MKFDAIVGNPPYQKSNKINSDDPIYHLFMDTAFSISDKVSFITPARFLFNAGKTPKNWNSKILNDKHFKVVSYIINSTDIFPNVDIKGGVAVTFRDVCQEFKKIGIYSQFKELNDIKEKVLTVSKRNLTEIITNRGIYKYSKKAYIEHPNELCKTADARIAPSAFERMPKLFTENKPDDGNEYIKIYGNIKGNRVYRWLKKEYIRPVTNIDKYKVMVTKANGLGKIGEVLSPPIIGEPLVGFTETYISIGETDSIKEAEAILKYIKSKFARCMLGILKVTQNNPKNVWKFVPIQDFTVDSDIDWSKSMSEIDKQLYKKYNLSKDQIIFIEEKIKPMN